MKMAWSFTPSTSKRNCSSLSRSDSSARLRGDLGLQGLVGCRQLVRALLLGDVDDRRTAKSPLPLAVLGGDALDQHIDRLPVLRSLTSQVCLVSVASTRLQKSANAGAVFRRHELPEPLLDHGVAVQAQQRGPGQVDLQNPPLVVPQEIPNRGEIEQVVVLLRCLLGRCLGTLEFFVLHLQFDLMHLQLVDQGAGVGFERGFSGA